MVKNLLAQPFNNKKMTIKQEIKKIIEKGLEKLKKLPDFTKISIKEILVERPNEKMRGDYASGIGFVLGKQAEVEPFKAVTLLKIEIEEMSSPLLEKIEIVNGFINFFIKNEVFIEGIKKIDKNIGKNKELKNKKIIIDYTDPNPFKEFHIGHLMSNAIGESISRLFEFQGAKVKRVCYQGDVGIHVAKAIWGKLNNGNLFWGQAYAFGAEKYRTDKVAQKEIREMNKKIYERTDREINKLYDQGKKESLEHFDKIYKKLDTKFDWFIFERETGELGKKIVEDGLKKGVFEEGENNTIIFKGEKINLHTRVFINSEGFPTYEAKELGLAEAKRRRYNYDISIVLTGNEINEYFKVVLGAMNQLLPDLAKKTKHISHGMLRLPEGKMSSRTGNIIRVESLLRKIEERIKEKIKDKDFSKLEKENIATSVAVGAIKYSILKQSIGSDVIYDFEKSISFEGNSGPYLQYSYARAVSVLRKAKAKSIKLSFENLPQGISQLEKKINDFEDVVLKFGRRHEPHLLVSYLTELASEFNSYYAKNKIVDRGDIHSGYKVAMTRAFTLVMGNGLWLLGIRPLKRM